MPQAVETSDHSREHNSLTMTEIAVGAALSAAAVGALIATRRMGIAGRAGSTTSHILPETKIAANTSDSAFSAAVSSIERKMAPGAGLGSESAETAATMVPPEYTGKFIHSNNPFQENGRLVAGTHQISWSELVDKFGHTREREQLLERFLPVARDLRAAKIETVEIGGSFASTKAAPKDIDFVWNNQQPGFSLMRLRWRNKDLLTAETDDLQYRGLHNINGALRADGTKSKAYGDALQFLRKVKVEPQVDFDIGSMRGYEDFKKLADLRQQARIEAARVEDEMRRAGTLYRNGVLQLDIATLPK